jgi:hypothetical protein
MLGREVERFTGGGANALPRYNAMPGQRLGQEGEGDAFAMSGLRSALAVRMAPRRRDAEACAAAMTAVVTGRISARTPRGRLKWY